MSVFQHAVANGSLDSILREFAAAHGLSDAELADWLEIPEERLAEIGAHPAPAPYTMTYHQDCMAIVQATGCDAWSLDVMMLWIMGKR